MADEAVVLAKLESIRHCLERIDEKRPDSSDALKDDYDLQDILSVNLERAIQQVVDAGLHIISSDFDERPGDMASVFDILYERNIIAGPLAVRLRKAVGFRNIAVHEYQKIDWDIVFSIITHSVEDFKAFIQAVLDYLDR